MNKIIKKYWKTYVFFLATIGVAFLVSMSMVKPEPPNAGVAEADEPLREVKSVSKEKLDNFSQGNFNFPELKNISPQMIPEPTVYVGSFLYQDPHELLKNLNVEYDKKAIVVESGVPAELGIGYNRVLVFEPQKVYFNYGGGSREGVLTTWAGTVGELLKEISSEYNLSIGEGDLVEPSRETKITRSDLLVLKITPIQDTEIKETETLPFKTIIEKDNTLELGRKLTKQSGQKGKKVLTYAVHREMVNEKWIETNRHLVNSEITKEPVEEITVQGTKIITYGIGKATFYNSKVAAHRTLPFGTKVQVVNLANGKSVVVTIGDRGPFGPGRVIDLPTDAFAQIASTNQGIVDVEIRKYYQE